MTGDRAPDFDARTRQAEYAGPGRERPDPADLHEIRFGYFGPGDPDDALGGDFWLELRKFARETMIGAGVISAEDIAFVHPTDSVEEAMSYLPALH